MQQIEFNTALLAEDLASKGWSSTDLARCADVAVSTVTRFMNGTHQTAPTAKKLATALGRSVRRYIVSRSEVA
jgi:plasmid maintenance system antidote protein VapI